MNNLFIVSTKIGVGKGGISTALLGYIESRALNDNFRVCEVTSHLGNSRISPMLSSAIKLATDCKKNDIVWLHCGPWFSMVMKFLLGLIAKVKGGKVVVHLHSPTLDSYLDSWFMRKFLASLFFISDGIIVLTPWWKERLQKRFIHLTNKIYVSNNPLDSKILDMAREPKLSIDSNKVDTKLLAMARLAVDKGFEEVLDTMVLLPSSYSLTIAGDGPLLKSLSDKAVSLGIEDRVEFLGWVEYENKREILESHDVFILPSKYDSFGMGFIEAMAAGLPVVALDYLAISDVVPNKVAGVLVDRNDPSILASAVIDCSKNKDLYGIAGKKYVSNKFNNESISQKLVSYFKFL
ncbi:hypothetical protein BCS94_09945 [Vibrio breoganii]|uniref:glycosyltransferase family 4 protein n=1 Tax=Vibrio breoganii TaxID=553239 RepID=UPI000C83B66C|nr:glycosyltransferase family 4 protein [Vibrio breoganii]PMP07278.1 hypothetical protein BCS94_09945 [Vibrio breoganii]